MRRNFRSVTSYFDRFLMSSMFLSSGTDTQVSSLLDPGQEGTEHALPVLPVVVPEGVLVEIALKVLRRDGVVYAADPAPDQRPEPFDRVHVDVPIDLDVLYVIDAPVLVPSLVEGPVLDSLVRVDRGCGKDLGCHPLG